MALGDHAVIHTLLNECADLAGGRADAQITAAWRDAVKEWEAVPEHDHKAQAFLARRLLAFVASANLGPAPVPTVAHPQTQELEDRRRYEDARSALRSQLASNQRSPLQENVMDDAVSPYTKGMMRAAVQGLITAWIVIGMISIVFLPILLLLPLTILLWLFWRWGAAKHLRRRLHLLRHGASVTARIFAREKISGGIYQLVLSYHHEDLDFLTPGAVSVGTFAALREGDSIPIRVDPKQPNIWMVAAQDEGDVA